MGLPGSHDQDMVGCELLSRGAEVMKSGGATFNFLL